MGPTKDPRHGLRLGRGQPGSRLPALAQKNPLRAARWILRPEPKADASQVGGLRQVLAHCRGPLKEPARTTPTHT